MFLEYISNMYVLSVIATVIGLCILYMYDKFEKKQYTNAIYMRIGILIFISCLGTVYISRMNFFQTKPIVGVSINPIHPINVYRLG